MDKEERDKKMEAVMQKLQDGVKNVFTSEKYQEYLRVMSKFHSYSANNSLLIYRQNPNASLVAGYQAWQKKFKRHVKRGEKAIQIFAPFKIKIKIDTKTNTLYKGDDLPEGVITKEITRFTVTSVFDISQTEGEPLPTIVSPLNGSVESYKETILAIEKTSETPILFRAPEDDPNLGTANGYYNPKDNIIVVREGMSEVQTVKTLVHELTHSRLHSNDAIKTRQEAGEYVPDIHGKELEAESTAYVVCDWLHIDTSDYSFGYVAGWTKGKSEEYMLQSLGIIQSTAKTLINDIQTNLEKIRNKDIKKGVAI